MRPYGAKFLRGRGGWLESANLVTHCLLLETDSRLILVDTGFGRDDMRNPDQFPALTRWGLQPTFNPDGTAHRTLEKWGYEPRDVDDILLTHLDLDHAGGLPDFPEATVHLLAPEWEAARSPGWFDRLRYVERNWDHDPDWNPVTAGDEEWFGFSSTKPLGRDGPELHLVSLPGHTAGHAGVAVPTDEGWLLHCGDAYFDVRETQSPPERPMGLSIFQRVLSYDDSERQRTQQRIRDLCRNHDDLETICAHSPEELECYKK
jgi:glyoxylase-like metal-dependent hydrolase (beta-lactamase superfamily II)